MQQANLMVDRDQDKRTPGQPRQWLEAAHRAGPSAMTHACELTD